MAIRQKAKTVLFLGLNEILNETFGHYQTDGFFNPEGEFSLVHIFSPNSNEELPPNINAKNEDEVKAFINEKLGLVSHNLLGDVPKDRIKIEILYHNEPKLRALNFLKESGADACVVATRGEQGVSGVFRESFAFYLVAHAPCDVLVLRPH